MFAWNQSISFLFSVSIVCMTNSSADITIGKHESEHKTMDIPEACQKHKVEDKHSVID